MNNLATNINELQSLHLPLALIGLASLVLLVYSAKKTNKNKILSVPGFPIIGNLLDMHITVLLDRMFYFKKVYGNIFHLQVFSHKFIHISDPQLCREILAKRPKVFKRGVSIDSMANKLNYRPYGLFHADDAVIWGKVKKLTAPAFSKQNLANMSNILYEETMALVQRMEELSREDADVEIPIVTARYTTAVINRVAFGNEPVEYFVGDVFYSDMSATLKVLLEAALFPFPEWVWRLTPMYKSEVFAKEANDRFTAASQEVIDRKRVQQASMGEEEKKGLHSLIDIMLRQDDVQDEEILANVKTFYVAGSDTTSVTLSWALFLLHQHPEAVSLLRQEAAPFFALDLAKKSSSEMSDALVGLDYAKAVFKEAIRLYPVGPLIFLDFLDKSEPVLLSDGTVIDTDRTVLLNMWTCMLDEEYFPNAEQFDPSRWLTEDKAQLGRMETAFMGFGAGTRACPGMGLALREGALALSALYHHFDLRLACPVSEISVDYKFTMQPNKLPMRVSKRK